MLITSLEIKEAVEYGYPECRFEEIESDTIERNNKGIDTVESILLDTFTKKYYRVLWKQNTVGGDTEYPEQDAIEVKRAEITVERWIPVKDENTSLLCANDVLYHATKK